MEDPGVMGPVCETLGITRSWLIGSEEPLQEPIDLQLSVLLELMDAGDVLYQNEDNRWRQMRGWMSRMTGRPAAEFAAAAPLLKSLRKQYRATRDEDLQAVTVWRRAAAVPGDATRQLQLTVRAENAARLRRLAQQLGSEDAALEFLLQMDHHCGKASSLRRTRWPPKVHYESARGQVKIDVGTEMVCVVLSQFKPAPQAKPPDQTAVHTTLQMAQKLEISSPVSDDPVRLNGHAVDPDAVMVARTVESDAAMVARTVESAVASHSAAPAPAASLSLGPRYGAVARDATLPAQMFADDDLAPDQLTEVQNQLTPLLDQLADDSNMASGAEDADAESSLAGGDGVAVSAAAAPTVAAAGKAAMEAGDGASVIQTDHATAEMTAGTEQMVESEETAIVGDDVAVSSKNIYDVEEMTVVSEEVTADDHHLHEETVVETVGEMMEGETPMLTEEQLPTRMEELVRLPEQLMTSDVEGEGDG